MVPFKGITLKMTGAIVAAVLGTAAALTVITTLLVSYTLRLSLKTRAVETSKILTESLSAAQQRLAIRIDITAGDEDFQRAFAFKDVELERLTRDLGERMAKNGASLALIADVEAKPITSVAAKGAPVGAQLLGGTMALSRSRASDGATNTVEGLGGQLYFVSAVPIKRYGEQTLGYLAMASPFDVEVLKQLQKASGAELYQVHRGELRASTSAVDRNDVLKAVETKLGSSPLVELTGLTSSGAPLIASAMPLKAGEKTEGALVFALSAHDLRAIQKRVLGASVGLAILISMLSGLVGFLIARRIADPIVEIEHSFREIAASGDLSRRITKGYSDEVGQMAESFNAMQEQIEQLHERVVAAEQRMRDELKMASAVQEMLFPTAIVDGARCQLAGHSQTSTETGGDWYTVIHAPERDVTTAIVSDVTGHGAPAALVTAILHGFFKATEEELSSAPGAQWAPTMQAVLNRLNQTMIESTRRSLVSTLFLLSIDHRTLTARYVNAGHLAPVILRTVDGKAQVTTVSTPPSTLIGDRDVTNFVTGEFQLQPNDLFLLYTDGLIECTNVKNEMYGFKRLRKVLQSLAHHDARTVRDLVLKDAMEFFRDQPPADDITVIVGRAR